VNKAVVFFLTDSSVQPPDKLFTVGRIEEILVEDTEEDPRSFITVQLFDMLPIRHATLDLPRLTLIPTYVSVPARVSALLSV